jgi:hypothetical protein
VFFVSFCPSGVVLKLTVVVVVAVEPLLEPDEVLDEVLFELVPLDVEAVVVEDFPVVVDVVPLVVPLDLPA